MSLAHGTFGVTPVTPDVVASYVRDGTGGEEGARATVSPTRARRVAVCTCLKRFAGPRRSTDADSRSARPLSARGAIRCAPMPAAPRSRLRRNRRIASRRSRRDSWRWLKSRPIGTTDSAWAPRPPRPALAMSASRPYRSHIDSLVLQFTEFVGRNQPKEIVRQLAQPHPRGVRHALPA